MHFPDTGYVVLNDFQIIVDDFQQTDEHLSFWELLTMLSDI